ncbi:mechanosensitive ion channel family protein [Alkalinema sp. FACHB-956]|uniref:mechanosensitive ion channel family protein n=1 Tax=Alkalinema sp. FACHB-956 TaxID=2692768 RepID=UPI001683171F|nr:mechanosensitive ion channel family protein [Alkalinema sp. FACHB-956]MBD2327919.1 mechanosensitive ion channel family protein [Alkalinema sp. FACHB-956]
MRRLQYQKYWNAHPARLLAIVGLMFVLICLPLSLAAAQENTSTPLNNSSQNNQEFNHQNHSKTNNQNSTSSSPTNPSNKLGQISLPALASVLDRFDASRVDTATITLDGYALFTIATPATQASSDTENGSAAQRAQRIESTLQEIVNQGRPQSLDVRLKIDDPTNLPIVYINEKYLMTVTTLDADAQGLEPRSLGEQIRQTLQQALEKAFRERQSDYLLQQGGIAAIVGLGCIALSYGLARCQSRSRQRQRQLSEELSAVQGIPSPTEKLTVAVTEQQQWQQMQLQQQLSWQKLKTRLYGLGRFIIWMLGLAYLFELFPQTRWLRTILLAMPLKLLGIALGVYCSIRLSDAIIDRIITSVFQDKWALDQFSHRLSIRLNTLSRVLKSALSLLIVSSGGLLSLAIVGVDLIPVLAGAGIIGLAVSFACQSLVKDVINGLLILLEDQYAVSDIVKIGEATGSVENMNLRITQLRDAEGRLITIPNSSINIVENLSKDWSRVDLTVEIDYQSDPDRALSLLKTMAQTMYHESPWNQKILEPPEVLGIDRINHVGLQIRIWLKTRPLEQFVVAREFRRRLKRLMDREQLGIGIPQQRLDTPIIHLETNSVDSDRTHSFSNFHTQST